MTFLMFGVLSKIGVEITVLFRGTSYHAAATIW